MSDLRQYVARQNPLIQREIAEFFVRKRSLAVPLTEHLVHSLAVLEEFSLRGGKMIRPMLVLLGKEIASGDRGGDSVGDSESSHSPADLQIAAGVELFHKHILNLDDMADRDERRNGGPTVWKGYEEFFKEWKDASHHARSFTEIDGTLLGSFAFELVADADVSESVRLEIMRVLIQQMYFNTVAGWQIHYFQNHQMLADANEAEFVKGLDLVTARYTFVGPLRIGWVLSGSTNEELWQALETYALKVGLAFQITDDILGMFGDPEEMGKPVGNDVREGKKTLLLQRAFSLASVADRAFLSDVCGRALSANELERVREVVRSTGALSASEEMAKTAIAEGLAALDTLPNSSAKEVLVDLAQSIVGRKK